MSRGDTAAHVGTLVRLMAVGLLVSLLGSSVGAAGSAAQVPSPPTRVGGEAVTAAVGAPPRPLDGAPYVALPPAGGNVTDAAASTTIGGIGTVELPGVTVSGGPTESNGSTATTTVTAWRVELFGGRVRAGDVRVDATANLAGGYASVDGDVTFESLVVDGVPYPAPAPNQEISLPGIGTLVVRERSIANFGPASATVFVRAFRIVVTDGGIAGVAPGGEVVVGAAAVGVPDVALAPPRALPSDALAPLAPDVAISTRAPIDTSIRQSLVDNVDFDNDNFDNDNFDGGDNDNAGTPGTPSGTSRPIVVTVVIVPVTATPSPTATPRP